MIWFVIIVATVVVLSFVLSFVIMRIACGRNDRFIRDFDKAISAKVYAPCRDVILQGKAWIEERKPQEVSTTSYDGLKLIGEYIPCENARGTVIMFHGWNASPTSDFGAGLPYYQSFGLNILLVHQRAQGKSEGKYMTFGIKERRDVHTWVAWHREQFGETPIFLVGLSMGAATVMMACGEDLPECVKGVIADCGFTSPYEIICSVLRTVHLPTRPLADMVGWYTKWLADFGLKEYSTLTAMKKMKLPLFLAHGQADTFVPCHMSQSAYDACACEDKHFLCVPEATHGMSFIVQPTEYQTALRDFFTRCLG